MGEVAQVPTQWSGDVAAMPGVRAQRRRRKGTILALMVTAVLS
jgi:hypothetical protein